MRTLVVITARGGSKGIPHKNIKPLDGKPLICYSIDVARQIVADENICVSTDDQNIIGCVENYGLKVPFVRPAELATDTSGSDEVLQHALAFYEQQGLHYDIVLLLQPTSPFRKAEHVKEAIALFHNDIDMVVSVKKSIESPYYNCFEVNNNGFLTRCIKTEGIYTRRQDAPTTYAYNGAIYVINAHSLKHTGLGQMQRVVKYEMDELHSLDLDTILDWNFAEFLIDKYQHLL